MYNKNEWIEDRAPTSGEDAKLADENWTVIQKCRLDKTTGENLAPVDTNKFYTISDFTVDDVPLLRDVLKKDNAGAEKAESPLPTQAKPDNEVWRFVKRQCLHCNEPACASSCFATAFRKNESGAVTYHPNFCVGCRYCMLACPFNIPKFEWDKAIPKLTKCMMCSSRIEEGDAPACVSVCPTNVMKFGEQEELLQEAREIIASDRKYVKHIYGEEEAGGTAWMYISDKPFEALGFKMNVPKRSIPSYTKKYMHLTPRFGAAWAAVLACLYFITWRFTAVKKDKESAVREEK
jgi:formate dehydrogenase iron-sulfur subunit